MARLSDHLRSEFYRWEQLGRGELKWEYPVLPEPPFIPFFGHGAFLHGQALPDDGRIESLGSKLLTWFKSGPPIEAPPLDDFDPFADLESESPPDYLLDLETDYIEFRLQHSTSFEVSSSWIEYFLYSISSAENPICFEIVAAFEGTFIQLVCTVADAPLVARRLFQYFPEVSLSSSRTTTADLVDAHHECALVSRELALAREFFLPIRTLGETGIDPYQGLLCAMDDIEEGEFAIIQIQFQPCLNQWADSILHSLSFRDGTSFFSSNNGFHAEARKKIQKPLYGVHVRLSAFADEPGRAREIARNIAVSFELFQGENGFILADDDDQSPPSRMANIALRIFYRSGMLLNAAELCSLVHFPSSAVSAYAYLRLDERSHEAPSESLKGSDLILGMNRVGAQEHRVGLSTDERARHMHVLGASGTGKSTFLLNCILQDIERGEGCALLDPHGDLVEAVLSRLPPSRTQDVIIFDPADEAFPIGFNILSARTEIERNLLASDFVSVFRRLSSAWGDQMTAILGNATLAILESEQGGTLMDLRRFLVERPFRLEFLRGVKDPEVRYFWEHEFTLLKGNSIASLLTRLNSFIRQKLIRNMISQPGDRLDFGQIMNDRKIFLAPLSQGLIGEENSWLLGSLLVSKFYQVALARQAQAVEERTPFWLYMDEAHNFVTDSIASILAGTRKYGLGLILAHQELDQFGRQESAVLGSILTNCHSRVCFRVGDHDAKRLQEGFEHFEATDLRMLGTGKAICRIGGSNCDFNLEALEPPRESDDGEVAQRAREHSRTAYATPREEVESVVNQRAAERASTLKDEKKRHPRTRRTSLLEPDEKGQVPSSLAPPEEIPPTQVQHDRNPRSEHEETTPQVAVPEETSPAVPDVVSSKVSPPVLPAAANFKKGWGGPKHKALQDQIKQHANGLGFRATVEAALPGGGGSVDVLLQTQSRQIAVEVALRSPIDQELRNIQKALEADISMVVMVSDSAAHLTSIRTQAEAAGLLNEKLRVDFVHADELGEFLNSLRDSIPPSEMTTLGYKVKASYRKLPDAELRARKATVHRAIDDAERRASSQPGSEEDDD